jgi:hypothetical protein
MTTFTVIIPTRDRALLVEGQVRRILDLAGAPDEVVVIDDGSSDDTSERLRLLEPRVTLIRGSGEGPAKARNLGAAAARAEWLIFLDDDDTVFDDWMMRFRQLARDAPDASYLSVGHESEDGSVGSLLTASSAFGHTNVNILAGTFAVRREVFAQFGGFDEQLRFGEFTELALRMFGQGDPGDGFGVHDPDPALRLASRPASERSSTRPQALAEATCRTLQLHRPLLARDPRLLADFLSVAGVALIRSGDARLGRRCLWEAARLDRWSAARWLRAGAASTPVTRRVVWARGATNRSERRQGGEMAQR